MTMEWQVYSPGHRFLPLSLKHIPAMSAPSVLHEARGRGGTDLHAPDVCSPSATTALHTKATSHQKEPALRLESQPTHPIINGRWGPSPPPVRHSGPISIQSERMLNAPPPLSACHWPRTLSMRWLETVNNRCGAAERWRLRSVVSERSPRTGWPGSGSLSGGPPSPQSLAFLTSRGPRRSQSPLSQGPVIAGATCLPRAW